MEPLARIAIVGHGLIGGSIARAVAERSPGTEVTTLDRGDGLGAVSGANLIVLAAPVSRNIENLHALASHVGDALVTDVGSTKASTVNAAEVLPARIRFIGGHPIAGAVIGGLDSARADLFEGRRWILTPTMRTRPDDIDRLRTFVESLGATVHFMDAASHDRLFAYVSHLPQLAISALMHVVGQSVGEAGLAFAGQGLRDSTRLASSPGDMWADVVASNRPHVNAAIDALVEALQALREREGAEGVDRIFSDAKRWKDTLEGDR
jgi:prephenate dehydrogenase